MDWWEGKGCFSARSCLGVLSLGAKGVSKRMKTPGKHDSPVVSSVYCHGDGCPSWLRGVLDLMVAVSRTLSG